MNVACIAYHKNAEKLYKKEWIDICVKSIKDQTLQDFTMVELNYGGTPEHYFEGVRGKYMFFNREFDNHIFAMNYLYSMLFANGFDVIMNLNMDDYYTVKRFETQLSYIKSGEQLVSSNWMYVAENGSILKSFRYHNRDIETELNNNHNVIAHPAVCMHKSFWDDDLHYNDLLGKEDLDLWQRAVKKGKRLFICPHFHLFYRIHDNQITKKYKA